MQKKLTITVSNSVYESLYAVVGRGKISKFIENLVTPHLVAEDLEDGYRQMAADEQREADALAWAEGTIGDGRA